MTENTAHQSAARDKALREAYGAATKQLRENHLAEFNTLRQKAAANLGIEWEPKPTKREKAEQDLLALLDENPDLAAVLAKRLAEEGSPAPVNSQSTE